MRNMILKTIGYALLTAGLFFSSSVFAQRYYGAYLCKYAGFTCVKIHRGDTWEKLFPNKRNREIVMRLNRTNMPVRYRTWIVVPTQLHNLNYLSLSPFPEYRNTDNKKLIVVDLTQQAFAAYDKKGELLHWGPISGGKGYCPDTGTRCATITGNFRILRKQNEDCVSSKFPLETNGGAPMPYCMHFHGGFALHGSTLPGYNASHGCVRLFFSDAKWLNKNFASIGTRVIVNR